MKVIYRHEITGVAYGNILWPEKKPGRNGLFPADHPCAAKTAVFGGVGDSQGGDGPQLREFRARGYWASCFPEGDGITMKTLRAQGRETVMKDIREVFGWEVRAGR